MDEKIVIERKAGKEVGRRVLGISLGMTILMFFATWKYENYHDWSYRGGQATMMETLMCDKAAIILGVAAIPLVLGAILYFWFANNQLTVTNKRIFGKVAFGKRVDLPLDSISAVALTTVFTQGLSVSSSSGRITFYYIPERQAVHKAISDLLVERQIKSKEPMIRQEVQQSNADELKKYKDLLDQGVITQEEFDAKKKQLLGL